MTLSHRIDASDYYDRDAAGFAARYDTVTFEAVHPLLCRYLPTGGRALDIGGGSGRDARALAARGFEVTAVEPSAGMRRVAQAQGPDIHWIDDRLPALSRLANEAGRFNLILCSAVLMLIAPANLLASFATTARLLAPTGRLAINVRQPMPGEPLELFFAHTDTEILAAAATAGLACLDRTEGADALGRAPYRWSSFIFERTA